MNSPNVGENAYVFPPAWSQAVRQKATLLKLLTTSVRTIADYQFCGLERSAVRRLFRSLADAKLVTLHTVMVFPELSLDTPVFTWEPGSSAPNSQRLAWALRSRWKGAPRQALIASATAKAQLETGGPLGNRPMRRTEVCHDLHVTALFFKFVREAPERARRWIHEDAADKGDRSTLIPDAMVGSTAIEFGGRYRAAKLRVIHRGHALAGRPYEIW